MYCEGVTVAQRDTDRSPDRPNLFKSVNASGGLLEITLDPPENFLHPFMGVGRGDRRIDSEIFREICKKILEIYKSASETPK